MSFQTLEKRPVGACRFHVTPCAAVKCHTVARPTGIVSPARSSERHASSTLITVQL